MVRARPVGVGDEVPQKLNQNVKLSYNFKRFPVQNLRFNEYRSTAGTVYFANTQLKKIRRFNEGKVWTPLIPRFGYASVDKSTAVHAVWTWRRPWTRVLRVAPVTLFATCRAVLSNKRYTSRHASSRHVTTFLYLLRHVTTRQARCVDSVSEWVSRV